MLSTTPIYWERDPHWIPDPDYPLEDWKYEVINNNTRLGYWDWIEAEKEAERCLNHN